MSLRKKAFRAFFIMLSLLLLLIMVCIITPDDVPFGTSTVSGCFMMLMSVIFFLYINWTMVKGRTRNDLILLSLVVVFFVVLRCARYISFRELNHSLRYIWYLYYIPVLLLPYLSFDAAMFIGRADDAPAMAWEWIPCIISSVFIVLVCTNDYHQLVFRLNEDFLVSWKDEYEYGFCFYLIYGWIAIMIIAFMLILYYKCRIRESRKLFWVPAIVPVVGGVYMALIAAGLTNRLNGHNLLGFPDTFCIVITFTWVGCIATGLVPANKAYTDIFGISSVHAMVTDEEDRIIYRSMLKEEATDENGLVYELRKEPIRGGFVLWQSDVGELNRINEELTAVRSQLQEENQIIRLENEMKETQAMIHAKNVVYDAIAVRVLPQSEKITLLSSLPEKDSKKQSHKLYQICLYGCYIKRISNLMLLGAQQKAISEMELALAIAESLNNLAKLNVATNIYAGEGTADYSAQRIVNAFEIYENYIEQVLDSLSGVYVTLKNGTCKLTLECRDCICLNELPGSFLECDEETCFISIPLKDKEVTV